MIERGESPPAILEHGPFDLVLDVFIIGAVARLIPIVKRLEGLYAFDLACCPELRALRVDERHAAQVHRKGSGTEPG